MPLSPARAWLAVVLLAWTASSSACPSACRCQLDPRGRHLVTCDRGGMTDPIPILGMGSGTEVIVISAPEDALNALTIGPIFRQFGHLEEVHIVRSNVPAIGRHSFWGVPTLRVLNLTHNNMSGIFDYNFRGLVNLVELRLDDNRIESMPSGTFRHLSELRALSLARNRVTELVPRLFLMLGKLHELDLSENQLLELNPEVFKDVQELRTLRCRRCGLTNINTLIYRLLPDLLVLDLGDNDFKYIASDEFRDLRKLQHLYLDGNRLPVVLEKTFSTQTDLQTVCLARNRLAKVTATAFANVTTLRDLDLGYNKLDKLDTATFVPLSESLHRLELSGNLMPLSEIKYVLGVVLKLREVGLADMGLTDLPLGLFVYHEHLRGLNVSGNRFVHFPVQLLSPTPKLQSLDLSRNLFHGLDERLIQRLEVVKEVTLRGNPWMCDLCHIVPMQARANKSALGAALAEVVCVGPYALRGRALPSIARAELGRCDGRGAAMDGGKDAAVTTNALAEESRLGFIAGGVAVLLVLLAGALLLAAVAYSKHHAAIYYTNEERRRADDVVTAVGCENGELRYKVRPASKEASNGTRNKKMVSIATIDGLHATANGCT